ncbi:DUF7284 family protein [Halorubrum pallidum]
MTSTVLDVTVMLLCVSASVVALSSGGLPNGGETPTAGEVADRLSTETVTVTYADRSAPDGSRTVHATRAELLALLTANGTGDADVGTATDEDRSVDAFERRTLAVVAAGLDDRTRIDARVRAVRSVDPTARAVAVGHPSTEPGETNDSTTPSAAGPPAPVTVGSAPPRGVDTTAAVITQPVPDAADASGGHVRIVVRRW